MSSENSEQRSSNRTQRILQFLADSERISQMTDPELGEAIMHLVWAEMPGMSYKSLLVEEAIARLLGPDTITTDEQTYQA